MKRSVSSLVQRLAALVLLAPLVPLWSAQEPLIHPPFTLKDATGQPVTRQDQIVSSTQSCMPCHDVDYIRHHSTHYHDGLRPGCLVCHFRPETDWWTAAAPQALIQIPENLNCASCHGVIDDCAQALLLPEDYTRKLDFYADGGQYELTQRKGEILAPQSIAGSMLNIGGKDGMNFPWDVHSRRQMTCTACHFTANDPRHCSVIQSDLDHLTRDPRRIKSTGTYLKWPDHRLQVATCTCCHDPLAVHRTIPYRERHLEVLSCQACHVPSLYGPAFRAVDKTVVRTDGEFRIEFRGSERTRAADESINVFFLEGYTPALFSHPLDLSKTPQKKGRFDRHLSPFNLVTTWFWKSQATGREVPAEILRSAFLDADGHRPDIQAVFDADGNGQIDDQELIIDTEEKRAAVRARLRESGVENPVIAGRVDPFPVTHGVVDGDTSTRDCAACHARDAKVGGDVILSLRSPIGATPAVAADGVELNGDILQDAAGRFLLRRSDDLRHHYVFGHGRSPWIDLAGLILFLLSLAGIALHGGVRVLSHRRLPDHEVKTERVYLYGFYERLWHWTMASSVILLLLTGFEIHHTGAFSLLGLANAVYLHNVLALILTVNAVLSLFYHLSTGEIRQFFRFNRLFFKESVVQLMYYVRGIFEKAPHPIAKTAQRKLNPLQQITYFVLLNVLLPFQVISGILMWAEGHWPGLFQTIGGLRYLAPLHNLGSWLVLAFLCVHLYLITTGHSPLSNLVAMITGYDDVALESEEDILVSMRWRDFLRHAVRRSPPETGGPGDEKK